MRLWRASVVADEGGPDGAPWTGNGAAGARDGAADARGRRHVQRRLRVLRPRRR